MPTAMCGSCSLKMDCSFSRRDGQKIIPAQDLQVTRQKEDLLKLVCIGEDGRQEQLLIGLRSGKGVDWYEAAE